MQSFISILPLPKNWTVLKLFFMGVEYIQVGTKYKALLSGGFVLKDGKIQDIPAIAC